MIETSADDPKSLYNIQNETNNLLRYAGYCGDYFIFDELAQLYISAIRNLDYTDHYVFTYYPGKPKLSAQKLAKNSVMWLDESGAESKLSSSQFLYLISSAVRIISDIEIQNRSLHMIQLVDVYHEVLADHYSRWLFSSPGPFQVKGWGCSVNGVLVEGGLNHSEILSKKMKRQLGDGDSPSYCNAVTDTDLWIIAGVSNFIAALSTNNRTKHIGPELKESLIEYLTVGLDLLEQRISKHFIKDWVGNNVEAANFDLGAWDDHQKNKYISYVKKDFPKEITPISEKRPQSRIGWDLSHARRFVHVFDTLHDNRKITGMRFPSRNLMKSLSNQFLYGSFNGDFDQPLFTNFLDGTNGWFRVGYNGRVGFGYGPWDLSISALTGGYGFWSKYNDQFEKLYCHIAQMMNSADRQIRNHVLDHYEKNHWKGYKRVRDFNFRDCESSSTQRKLIQFIPSLCLMTNISDCLQQTCRQQ